MPIVKDSQGAKYASILSLFQPKPEDFFGEREEEYAKRIQRMAWNVCEFIRYADRPLYGRGLNHDLHGDHLPTLESLASLIMHLNNRRVVRLKKQRRRESKYGLGEYETRLRSPQDIKRRRSAMFGAKDIPEGYFEPYHLASFEIDEVITHVITLMYLEILTSWKDAGILYRIGNVWHFSVEAMDAYRKDVERAQQCRHHVKRDDRSFHGKPSSDKRRKIFSGVERARAAASRHAA